MTTDPCVFCDIIANLDKNPPPGLITEWEDAIALHPLNPVTEGHTLIIPRAHAADFATDWHVTAATAGRASEFVSKQRNPMDWNLITSKGPAATQTVYHLHVHLVPRRPGDGLHLPWTEEEGILARLDRVIELLEDIRDARRARIEAEITTLADPERVYLPDVDE